MTDKYEEKAGASAEGLVGYFRENELLPWKKFLFKIEHVGFDTIILKVVGHKKPGKQNEKGL